MYWFSCHRIKYNATPIPSGTESTRFESFDEEYQKIFRIIANADQEPVYLHCTAGADCTVIMCFALLTLCGASSKDVATDYCFINFAKQGARNINSEFMNWWNKLES